MAQRLRKSFRDSLSDMKERMKEKRIEKLTRLGKTSQSSAVNCKLRSKMLKYLPSFHILCFLKPSWNTYCRVAASRCNLLKSMQANNKALAQALQEEKLRVMDAEATILQLRKDYHDLKVQMFDLQRKLGLKQAQGLEVFLIILWFSEAEHHYLHQSTDLFIILNVSWKSNSIYRTSVFIFSSGLVISKIFVSLATLSSLIKTCILWFLFFCCSWMYLTQVSLDFGHLVI